MSILLTSLGLYAISSIATLAAIFYCSVSYFKQAQSITLAESDSKIRLNATTIKSALFIQAFLTPILGGIIVLIVGIAINCSINSYLKD